ncbi:hypothetical protein Bbelb_047050 [Branchiostoma belcheri]|nr:hypothetical protein Bbelb_047050 [Branchiostoma belcheri]
MPRICNESPLEHCWGKIAANFADNLGRAARRISPPHKGFQVLPNGADRSVLSIFPLHRDRLTGLTVGLEAGLYGKTRFDKSGVKRTPWMRNPDEPLLLMDFISCESPPENCADRGIREKHGHPGSLKVKDWPAGEPAVVCMPVAARERENTPSRDRCIMPAGYSRLRRQTSQSLTWIPNGARWMTNQGAETMGGHNGGRCGGTAAQADTLPAALRSH